MLRRFFLFFKWFIFPGLNLHARLRHRSIPSQLEGGRESENEKKRLLDAGCGNGMIAYQAYTEGYTATGVSNDPEEIAKCREFYHEYLGVDDDKLWFQVLDLYELDGPEKHYDEIVCSEVLEHLMNDELVCAKLFDMLKPGGVLHVTVPNAAHPYNANHELDEDESGGHVRPGYTRESLNCLLVSQGFEIISLRGLGGSLRQAFNVWIKNIQMAWGKAWGVPIFALSLPFWACDKPCPELPYCIYARARKPWGDRNST